MGKPKDIAWGQVDIGPKNESVVCCKHCKAKLLIGSNQSISAVKKHLKAQHFPVFHLFTHRDIGIAGFWNGIPSLFRYRPALEYRPVTDFYGIPAEG